MKKKSKKHIISKTSNHFEQKKITLNEQNKLRLSRSPKTLKIFDHDLDCKTMKYLCKQESLSIDTETGGLDVRECKLFLVQIATEDGRVYMVRNPTEYSVYLNVVLLNRYTSKIFHNAAFDLGFLYAWLGVLPNGQIECTKTLMKICEPSLRSGLGACLEKILNITIDKQIDHTEWNAKKLSKRQIQYAGQDVLYLHRVLKKLKTHHISYGDLEIYLIAMDAIRAKVFLEIQGYTDLLDYSQNNYQKTLKERNWFRNKTLTFTDTLVMEK